MVKVSFIIVAYQAAGVIKHSLDSLKSHNYPHQNIEVILVDGMSQDGAKKMMQEYQRVRLC